MEKNSWTGFGQTQSEAFFRKNQSQNEGAVGACRNAAIRPKEIATMVAAG
jgi:hypothetical protein